MPDPVKFAGLVFTLHAQLHTHRHKHMRSCRWAQNFDLLFQLYLIFSSAFNPPSNRFANKSFYNYFCYFWSPSQAHGWGKKRKSAKNRVRMTEWGYGGEVVGVKGLWEAVNASCPDACPHLFEPQHFTGTSSTAYNTHKHAQPLSHIQKQTGIASDTSSVRQLWDWARKWGLLLTAQ